jgi:hypothetical protein
MRLLYCAVTSMMMWLLRAAQRHRVMEQKEKNKKEEKEVGEVEEACRQGRKMTTVMVE